MDDFPNLAFAVFAGMLLGAIFFGGLWWTVRKGISSARPALLFCGSLLLRMGIVLTGFYFILGDNWVRLMAGLVGFVAARLLTIRLTGIKNQSGALTREAGHAP